MSTFWEKKVVRATLEGAGDFPSVQLELLLRRLETRPDTLPVIAEAIRDMGHWLQSQAEALEAEGRRRAGGAEIVNLKAD